MVQTSPSPSLGAILLVEDDPTFAGYLVKRLSQVGYQVEWAQDGLRALAQLRRGAPGLLLMDLAIPAIDGISLLRQLRTEGLIDGVPVIVLTGRYSASDVEDATALGVVDYIAKPFDEPTFLASIATHIRA